ncbi:hypothetical protein ABH935_010159 [Catenulispora sp. GAS73]|uniref:hypothetical protein n=1 Tax=Catenulispora sp. GAS73 TaxID=3156269 RepID=UPI003513A8DB
MTRGDIYMLFKRLISVIVCLSAVVLAGVAISAGPAAALATYVEDVPSGSAQTVVVDISSSAGLPDGTVIMNITGKWYSPNAYLADARVQNDGSNWVHFYAASTFLDAGGQFDVQLVDVPPFSSSDTPINRWITGTFSTSWHFFIYGTMNDSGPGGAAVRIEEAPGATNNSSVYLAGNPSDTWAESCHSREIWLDGNNYQWNVDGFFNVANPRSIYLATGWYFWQDCLLPENGYYIYNSSLKGGVGTAYLGVMSLRIPTGTWNWGSYLVL